MTETIKQAGKLPNKQTNKQTNTQTHKQKTQGNTIERTNERTNKQTTNQTSKQTQPHTHTPHSNTSNHKHKHTNTDTQTHRKKNGELFWCAEHIGRVCNANEPGDVFPGFASLEANWTPGNPKSAKSAPPLARELRAGNADDNNRRTMAIHELCLDNFNAFSMY